jgi:hypothetical protein
MKVALFNDTGNFHHVGCLAVTDAHDRMMAEHGAEVMFRHYVNELHDVWRGDRDTTREQLRRSPLVEEISAVDAVVVNGEGTIHHGAGMHLLAILELAIEMRKGAFLVNAVLQDLREYFDLLGKLDDLVVREWRSAAYVSRFGARSRLVGDSILGARFEDGSDRQFDGRVLITDCHHLRNDVRYQLDSLLTSGLRSEVEYFPLENVQRIDDWRSALRKFRAARFVVTGRHHGVYLALMAGTPFVALPSNTWKIESTLEMLHATNALWRGNSLIEQVLQSEAEKDYLRKVFDNDFLKPPLTTLQGLHNVGS